jgi:hypothetical protein
LKFLIIRQSGQLHLHLHDEVGVVTIHRK